MYEYRQALMRMRQGDSEREIARSKLMGRSKAARFRELARAQGSGVRHFTPIFAPFRKVPPAPARV